MSAINVLEVMDHAIRCVRPGVSEEHYQWHKRLTEARAAMADLMGAANDHYEYLSSGKTADRLKIAIARCQGEQ